MILIWSGLFFLIFMATIIWAFWFSACIFWYYVRLISMAMLRFRSRDLYSNFFDDRKAPKIRIKRYYSLFRTPLLFYFSLPFLGVFISSFINDYLLRNLRLEESLVFSIFSFLIILFWLSVYVVFSFAEEKNRLKKL